jgi:hypothetical protein
MAQTPLEGEPLRMEEAREVAYGRLGLRVVPLTDFVHEVRTLMGRDERRDEQDAEAYDDERGSEWVRRARAGTLPPKDFTGGAA